MDCSGAGINQFGGENQPVGVGNQPESGENQPFGVRNRPNDKSTPLLQFRLKSNLVMQWQ
ncbi:hypothetical protein [Lentibacillus juripiscarius]|uniref:Uncharacterized protein n=1 Tax=Lentibacillus juripiscarius TaxID=257446 RepID=A0ABW5VA48_9BACI